MMSDESKKNATEKASQMDLAITISDRVKIDNIILAESSIRRSASQPSPEVEQIYKYNVDHVGWGKNDDLKTIYVIVKFSMVSNVKDESDKPYLEMNAQFVLFYNIDSFEGVEDQAIKAFAATNGLYNAWPYWREYVQNSSVRMGIEGIVAPVFRITGRPSDSSAPSKDGGR